MSRLWTPPTVAILALLWPGSAPGQAHREISGVVVNARSGQPVSRAEIALRQSMDGKIVAKASSDAEGRFAFLNLHDGKFGLIATAKGYVPSAYQEHESGVSTAIVTGESQITTGLRFELAPQARITGEVQEDSGDPVPNARVSLYRKDPNGTGAMTRVRIASADAMGSFEFVGLGEGTYLACAFGSPWYAMPMQPWWRPGAEVSNRRRSTLDVAYPPTCYPETSEPSQAEAILLNAGNVLPVTIIMHPAPAVHIVMQVPRPDPKRPFIPPQFAAQIFGIEEQIQTPTSFSVEGDGENADAPARMEITGLTAGQYEMSLLGQNGEPSRQMSVDLAPDHASLDLAAANALPDLTGQVVTSTGENPRPGSFVWLFPRQGGSGNAAPVQADSTFAFPALRAGEYDIRVVMPLGGRTAIASMAAKGGQLSGHFLKVGNQPVKLAIVVAEAKATVNGIATRHGRPVPGLFIVMVPANPRSVSEQLQTNQSDSDGTFNFLHVAAGTYVVVAIEEGWKLDWARPQAMAPYLANGVKVTVPADAREVNLPTTVEAQPSSANPLR